MDMTDRPSIRLSVMSLYDRFTVPSVIYDNPAATYEKHPSPPTFSRLQAMALAEIYILGWFCGWWLLSQLVALGDNTLWKFITNSYFVQKLWFHNHSSLNLKFYHWKMFAK
jgi:hypothetical protein